MVSSKLRQLMMIGGVCCCHTIDSSGGGLWVRLDHKRPKQAGRLNASDSVFNTAEKKIKLTL